MIAPILASPPKLPILNSSCRISKVDLKKVAEQESKKYYKYYFQSKRHQREFMERIFLHLQYQTLSDFTSLTQKQLRLLGGHSLLTHYYKSNYSLLLQSVFPNYPWSYYRINQKPRTILTKEEIRSKMTCFYHSFSFSSLEDWVLLPKKQFLSLPGTKALLRSFSRTLSSPSLSSNIRTTSSTSKLSRFDDCCEGESGEGGGGGSGGDGGGGEDDIIIKLLTFTYPNFPFDFSKRKKISQNRFFKKRENQRYFMISLFHQFQMRSLEEFLTKFSRHKLIQHGGKSLIGFYYRGDYLSLLFSIFPNFPWLLFTSFTNTLLQKQSLHNLDLQRSRLEMIGMRLGVKSLEDWKRITRHQFLRAGGYRLLHLYHNSFPSLLLSLYPSYSWNHHHHDGGGGEGGREGGRGGGGGGEDESLLPHTIKYKPHGDYFKLSINYNKLKLKEIRERYHIQRKEHWYRLPLYISSLSLLSSLQLIYPSEVWSHSQFSIRTKKSIQRLMYASLLHLLGSSKYQVIEDYRHHLFVIPWKFGVSHSVPLELDVFVPSLSLALEYQGEHHYNEIPSTYSSLSLHQLRDEAKAQLSRCYQITLIRIPYWWDLSLSSLYSSLSSQFPLFLQQLRTSPSPSP